MAGERIKAAEVAALACALLSDDAFYFVCSSLKETDFLDKRNQTIYHAMLEIYGKEKIAPNMVSLRTYLETSNKMTAVGGESYLAKVLDTVPANSDAENYVKQVMEASQFFRMKNTLAALLEKANKGVTDIPAFLGESQKKVNDILQIQNADNFQSSGDVIEAYLDKLEKKIEERRLTGKNEPLEGVSTGYKELDKFTRGFAKGDLIILAARPSVGKTAFAINLALNVSKKKIPVAFFSLEMSAEKIIGRLLTNLSTLNQDTINSLNFIRSRDSRGNIKLSPDPSVKVGLSGLGYLHSFQSGLNLLEGHPIFIDDNPGTMVIAIQAELRKFQTQHPDLGLVIIDYLQLINSATGRTNSNENRTNVVGEISRALKSMARDLNVPVIALAQLSRAVDNRTDHTPTMSDLRDSGSIEADADIVMMLYRKDYYERNGKDGGQGQPLPQEDQDEKNESITQLIIAKNRNGRTGELEFTFKKDICLFSYPDYEADSQLENEEQEPVGF